MRKTVFPKSHDFQPRAAGNRKFFDPAIFQKCWRGVGEQPTFAKQIILQSVFPAAIAIFKTSQFEISCFYETSCKFGQGNGAIAARWQAKAGVEPPFAGRERPFFLRTMIANHEPQANKSFLIQQFFKNAGEVCASSPHLRNKSFCNPFSLLQLHF